ncbi:uncharacterized protein BDZ99DRAFT_555828 [Mytilinidion resinicola]|uniref:RING-type domain-containing protein n=1 Tax=Mytilinidion resinicola TaxID=574789 RepID=A0A6A6YY75_9PEZI|nr:uncharacterized protein BDZ99DRAFT_555828 [Mytilinidion resinicola]KAF2812875.1 hypothetical protein BDZ99DRAFT_555828 [Mytilinidion resinicola]
MAGNIGLSDAGYIPPMDQIELPDLNLDILESYLSLKAHHERQIEQPWVLRGQLLGAFMYLQRNIIHDEFRRDPDTTEQYLADMLNVYRGMGYGGQRVRKIIFDSLAEHCDTPTEENECCAICFGEFSEHNGAVQARVCKHIFGRDCLETWVNQHGQNTTCPLCRRRLLLEEPRAFAPSENVLGVPESAREEAIGLLRELRDMHQELQRQIETIEAERERLLDLDAVDAEIEQQVDVRVYDAVNNKFDALVNRIDDLLRNDRPEQELDEWSDLLLPFLFLNTL